MLDEKKPFRILFYVSYKLYTVCMDRWFFELHDAMKQVEGVETYMWGPYFEGYNNNISLEDNVRITYGHENFFIFSIHHHLHLPTDPLPVVYTGQHSIRRAVMLHESFSREGPYNKNATSFQYRTKRELLSTPEFGIAFFAYATDMAYYPELSVNKLFVHAPLYAHKPRYSRINTSNIVTYERKVDVLLVGRLVESMYPFRCRIARLMNESLIPGIVREHPGFFDLLPENDIKRMAIDLEFVENQANEYAASLMDAKIVVATQSKRKLPLRKYIEGAMAGALVAGDIPPELLGDLDAYTVEIKDSMTDGEIAAVFKHWLENNEARWERAVKGFEIVTKNYTSLSIAYQVKEAIEEYLRGRRGMWFTRHFKRIDYNLPYLLHSRKS